MTGSSGLECSQGTFGWGRAAAVRSRWGTLLRAMGKSVQRQAAGRPGTPQSGKGCRAQGLDPNRCRRGRAARKFQSRLQAGPK